MGSSNKEQDYSQSERMLRQDLAAEKVRWYADWKKDLWCHFQNNHPLFAMYYTHPLHPIARGERAACFFLQLLLVFFISCAILEGSLCMASGVSTCDQQDDSIHRYHSFNVTGRWGYHTYAQLFHWRDVPRPNFCCLVHRIRLFWFLKMFGPTIGGLIYTVLANIMFACIIFQLMKCACVQTSSPRSREIGEIIGYTCFLLVASVLLFFVPLLAGYIYEHGLFIRLVGLVVLGKLTSWTLMTLWLTLLFNLAWKHQSNNTSFQITADDYNRYITFLTSESSGEDDV